MNVEALAFYLGYAFCQAVNVQHVIEEDALMVPFVAHWKDYQPTAIPYPGKTQNEAVNSAIAARNDQPNTYSGWSFGRDGLVTLSNGQKHDVLLIEASVTGLNEPVTMFYLYRRKPFTLVGHFNFQNHPQVRKNSEGVKIFMGNFRRGLESHSFGKQCLKYVETTQPQ